MNWKDETNQDECRDGRLLFLRTGGGDDHRQVRFQTIENALRQPHVGLTHVAALRLGETTSTRGTRERSCEVIRPR